MLGMTPAASIRRAAAASRFVSRRFRPGSAAMLVAATDRGLCRVALGDDPSALEQQLRDEFPAADVRRGPRGPRAARPRRCAQPRLASPSRQRADARRAGDGISAPRSGVLCRRFPAGERAPTPRSPGKLANPRSARAVARACATNPVALAVPCHRVVPTRAAQAATAGASKGSRNCWRMRPETPSSLSSPVRQAELTNPGRTKDDGRRMPVRYGQSPWTAQLPKTSRPTYPKLSGRLDIPIAIVGAGLTGCATAYALAAAGQRVALVESGQIAAGATGAGGRVAAGVAWGRLCGPREGARPSGGARAVAGHAPRVARRAGDASPAENPLQSAALRRRRRRAHRRGGQGPSTRAGRPQERRSRGRRG